MNEWQEEKPLTLHRSFYDEINLGGPLLTALRLKHGKKSH